MGAARRCHRISVGQSPSPSPLLSCPTLSAAPPARATTSSLDLAWQRSTLHAASPAAPVGAAPVRSPDRLPCAQRGVLSATDLKPGSGVGLRHPPHAICLSRQFFQKIIQSVFFIGTSPGRKYPPVFFSPKNFQTKNPAGRRSASWRLGMVPRTPGRVARLPHALGCPLPWPWWGCGAPESS
jgi:hypothetical protein